ncbi:helix-turn-helix domain-containing protein [Siccirubricoccus sp. KC 17139]|uniref:Helix-turn-helix domain-containing protein n=1 Tax=Siccirubricoccus soli TaxID=2899147 RepID=A0ABT1DBP2_9PROT|nr:helix-turn-helix domain-containing protein [Siccirubricoccus soli]MCO6419314.1 helix-turn-helix domain-containing protein [Siccirubricoccus soli]MCP2685449.1 helix-turn-helix domain-containing protein [Siccirubricoccus soli]
MNLAPGHGEGHSVVLDRTWTEMAAELGLTREATYRALARLEADGRIVRGENLVSLCAT